MYETIYKRSLDYLNKNAFVTLTGDNENEGE